MPILSTSTGSATTGVPVNDAYGSKTETAGTAILRVIPPRAGHRAWVSGFLYRPGATAHTVTFLTAVAVTTATEAAESGQAVLKLASLNYAPDGSAVANTDYFVVQHSDGTYDAYLYSSASGLSVTMATNLSADVAAGATVWYMAAPGDHANRQYLTVASADFSATGSEKTRIATARANGEPILVHVDNATNAGNLKWVAYSYGDA